MNPVLRKMVVARAACETHRRDSRRWASYLEGDIGRRDRHAAV